MEWKVIITESLIDSLLYTHIGMLCFFGISAILWKLSKKNNTLEIFCTFLEIGFHASGLIVCTVALFFCYINNDSRLWVLFVLTIFYTIQLGRIIRIAKKGGWRGLMR